MPQIKRTTHDQRQRENAMARRDEQQPDLFSFEETDDPRDQWMRQAVNDVYRQWLTLPDEWSTAQQQRYLHNLTSRLDRMAAELADTLAAAAITQWTTRRGQHPDFLTTVALRETALQNARETIVRQELYDLISQDDSEETVDFDPPLRQPVPASQVPWDLRWNDARYRSDPGEGIEALAEMVWPAPAFSVMFRIKAAYLLIARIEDKLPVPDSPRASAGRAASTDGLRGSTRRRLSRAVDEPQLSLFEDFDQPTDPRRIDPGGRPLPPVRAATSLATPTAKHQPRPAPQPVASVEVGAPAPGNDTVAAPTTNALDTSIPQPAAEQVIAASPPSTPQPATFNPGPTVRVPSGSKARIQANLAAIDVLQRLRRDGDRPATADEQDTLACWSGWGAVAEVFDRRNDTYAGERDYLHQTLGPDAYRAAEASVLNAHYTDPAIAQAMWAALQHAGFSGGRVLEPGCGSEHSSDWPRLVP